jgi:hypothetical protein
MPESIFEDRRRAVRVVPLRIQLANGSRCVICSEPLVEMAQDDHGYLWIGCRDGCGYGLRL